MFSTSSQSCEEPGMSPELFSGVDSASDILLLISAPLAAYFLLSYGLFSPWYKVKRHGWVGVMTFLHAVSVFALVSLVVYATIFDQRADEWYRLSIAALLVLSLLGKIAILHYERHNGLIARRKNRREP